MKKGFSVIELVVVVAVIAILAAVLIPTFSSIVSKAYGTQAQSDARNAITQVLSGSTGSTPNTDCVIKVTKNNEVYWYTYTHASFTGGGHEAPEGFNASDYTTITKTTVVDGKTPYSDMTDNVVLYVKK